MTLTKQKKCVTPKWSIPNSSGSSSDWNTQKMSFLNKKLIMIYECPKMFFACV